VIFLRIFLLILYCCGITCGFYYGITCGMFTGSTYTGRETHPILPKYFLRINFTFPEEISAGTFPAVSKILRKQLPTKVLPGSANPWQNRQETCFLRIYHQIPYENPQENREFLVVSMLNLIVSSMHNMEFIWPIYNAFTYTITWV